VDILCDPTNLKRDMSNHTYLLLALGFAASLLGAPILLVTVKLAGGNQLGLAARLALWALAGAVCGIALLAGAPWSHLVGLRVPSWQTLRGAAAATVAVLAAWPLLQYVQGRLGGVSITQNPAFQKIAVLSVSYRIFLVITAAVTEEVLYRGFAIGVGSILLGNPLVAATLSIVIFTSAHFRWGLGHMLSVFWVALVFTTLFVVTGDLWACIAAHAASDATGLLIAPAMMARRNRAAAVSPVEHFGGN
jgi:membrane protease YdiL (CAAX protease family)